jgi:hypothetical protein
MVAEDGRRCHWHADKVRAGGGIAWEGTLAGGDNARIAAMMPQRAGRLPIFMRSNDGLGWDGWREGGGVRGLFKD